MLRRFTAKTRPSVLGVYGVVLALLLGACGSDGVGPQRATPGGVGAPAGAGPAPAAHPPKLTEVTTVHGVSERATLIGRVDSIPTAAAATPDGRELLVAQGPGQVRRFTITRRGRVLVPELQRKPALDLSAATVYNGQNRGLLGLAVTADGRHLLASFTDHYGSITLQTFPYHRGATVDPADGVTILSVRHPLPGLGGGGVAIDRNGNPLVGIGDMDQKNWSPPSAQDPRWMLGTVVRVPAARVDGDPKAGHATVIVDGIRNPWGISVDKATGDVWLGDVGGGIIEEFNRVPAGAKGITNFGWPYYDGNAPRVADLKTHAKVDVPKGFTYTKAVLTRTHAYDICAAVGGSVSRGAGYPELYGAYVYADLCSSGVRALVRRGDKVVSNEQIATVTGNERVVQLSQAPDGTLYVLGILGGIWRLDPAGWQAPNVKAPPRRGGFKYPEEVDAGVPANTVMPPSQACAVADSFFQLDGLTHLSPTELESRLDLALRRIDAAIAVAPADQVKNLRYLSRVFQDLRAKAKSVGWKAGDPSLAALLSEVTEAKAPYEQFDDVLNGLLNYFRPCGGEPNN